jgi:DnaJ-class molecular chaperone
VTNLVTCPDCQGSRQVEVYACPGFRRALVDCTRCGTTGQVTAAEAERVAEGKRRAEDRKARGLSLWQEAERLGVTPMELGDIEHARPVGTGS